MYREKVRPGTGREAGLGYVQVPRDAGSRERPGAMGFTIAGDVNAIPNPMPAGAGLFRRRYVAQVGLAQHTAHGADQFEQLFVTDTVVDAVGVAT